MHLSSVLHRSSCGPAIYPVLLSRAYNPERLSTLAIAGVVARAWQREGTDQLPLIGLDALATRRMLETHFRGADTAFRLDWKRLSSEARAYPRGDETEDIVSLLGEHAAADDDDSRWVIHSVATGCMGANHLWEDMGLPSRKVLTALLQHYFPGLAARNTGDMKWKKFFYKQLCEREALFLCRAPSCGVCADHAQCFGPEEATPGAAS